VIDLSSVPRSVGVNSKNHGKTVLAQILEWDCLDLVDRNARHLIEL
jgi:hypothetical protein